jgi:signal transduction histidine kinase
VAISLRSRLILASLLWTAGLLLLMHLASTHLIHVLPSFRSMDLRVWIALGVVAMVGGLLAARAGLVTLRRLREQIEEVSSGIRPRVDGAYPAEVGPLIDSLNRMLEERERTVKRAHAVAGDLAHALKTPLALLAREADAARTTGAADLAEAIARHVQRMAAQIDYQLARTRLISSAASMTDRTPLGPIVDALLRTLGKIHADRRHVLASDVESGLVARVRQEDLEEMLGNVLDNACKWASTEVRIRATGDEARLTVVIEDDGPGLREAMRSLVLERGVRLDESAPGSGIGLSIVRELAEHYGGSASLGASSLGGLLVQLDLPAARDA